MARPMSRRQLEKFAQSLEPEIRREFLAVFAGIRNEANLAIITELVAAGRVDAIAEALGLAPARFGGLTEAVRAAFLKAGLQTAAEMPVLYSDPTALVGRPIGRMALRFRFDIRAPGAERWVAERSARLVTEIIADQRQAIRQTLAAAMQAGRGPRQSALDLVGRVAAGGRRTGGTIGLTSQQAAFVTNARAELQALSPAYFRRTLRDKRFDSTIRKAIESGKPLTQGQIDRIVGRYSDSMLRYRGEVVARTEALTALHAARHESYAQAIEAGGLSPENVTVTWGATGDARTRDSHAEMHGQVVTFGQPFEAPSGARMRYPGDTELGAGPEETIQCRCRATYRISYANEANRGAQ